MKHHPKRLNILLVAAISGTVNWVLAMLFVLLLLPMLVSFGALPGSLEAAVTNDRMAFAVAAPFAFAALCFGLGILMAFLYNLHVKTLLQHKPLLEPTAEPALKDEAATVGDAA